MKAQSGSAAPRQTGGMRVAAPDPHRGRATHGWRTKWGGSALPIERRGRAVDHPTPIDQDRGQRIAAVRRRAEATVPGAAAGRNAGWGRRAGPEAGAPARAAGPAGGHPRRSRRFIRLPERGDGRAELSPRSSKPRNWSKLAQAGASGTTSPGWASRARSPTARSRCRRRAGTLPASSL
jgi:hypothetical protein